MSEKFLIFGATGSIGSSLAEQLKNSGNDIHLIARNESEVSSIAEKLGCSFTVADVLEEGFIEKVKADISEIKRIAYCIGSIDLKPLRMVTEQDFNKCMKLNLYSAVEAIKGYQESLKKNKGSIVLFSTVAAQRGFTNHANPLTSRHFGSQFWLHRGALKASAPIHLATQQGASGTTNGNTHPAAVAP